MDLKSVIQLNNYACAVISYSTESPSSLHDEPEDRIMKYVTSNNYHEWCLGHTHLLNRLLLSKGLEPFAFHYGSSCEVLRHVVTLLTIGETQYLFDPLFGCHCVHDGQGDWVYGNAVKRVNISGKWELMSGKNFWEYHSSKYYIGIDLTKAIRNYFTVKAYVPDVEEINPK